MGSFHIGNDAAFWLFGEDQTTIWSETPGSVQPALELDWGQDGPLTDIDRDSAALFKNSANGGASLANFETGNANAFQPAFNYPYSHPGDSNRTHPDVFSPWYTPPMMPSPTAGDSIGSSQSDASWAGLIPSTTQAVAEPQAESMPTSSVAPATPQADLAWLENAYVDVASSVSTIPWGFAYDDAPPLGWADVDVRQSTPRDAYTPSSLTTLLGKRARCAEASGGCIELVNDGNRCGPRKRVKIWTAEKGVWEAGVSTSMAHQRSATRIQAASHDIIEGMGCGEERLAVPNAHEVYHQILPGPSVQGKTTGTTAEEELPWAEGGEEGATWRCVSSVVQPQEGVTVATGGETEVPEGDDFRIPKRLSERHRGLLKATSDDWARGTIRELRCQLCPGAAFCNWEDFKRHCDLMEAHPLRISFCSYCGDFFARADSLARHCRSRPPECLGVTPDEALTKRRETEKVHVKFQERLERYLRTNEEIGSPFAQTIKEMYPGSSKRGSRQQSRLKSPKSKP